MQWGQHHCVLPVGSRICGPDSQKVSADEPSAARADQMNAADRPEFEFARVFDFADPVTGPGFAPDHPVISDSAERDRLLEYLRGGAMVLMSTTRMRDVLESGTPAVVPMNFRTDGKWIWTDTVEYYLAHHGVAPDAGLTAHIDAMSARGRAVPDTSHDTAVRAADFLLRPAEKEGSAAVWTAGPDTGRPDRDHVAPDTGSEPRPGHGDRPGR